jgi:hypothetical protein
MYAALKLYVEFGFEGCRGGLMQNKERVGSVFRRNKKECELKDQLLLENGHLAKMGCRIVNQTA